jgi:transcriptional regulator with XRE-family HTH domain
MEQLTKKTSFLNQRLSQLMNEKNINLSSLAQKAGLAIGTVQKMLTDSHCNPTISSLESICDALNVSISYLIGRHENPNFTPEIDVPLLNWGTLTEDLLNLSKKPFSKNKNISSSFPLSENSFALKIIESSMMPIFPMGTTLIFDKNKAYYDGCYVLVYLNVKNEYAFKRLLIDKPNLYIKSINPLLKENTPSPIEENQIIATLAQAKM